LKKQFFKGKKTTTEKKIKKETSLWSVCSDRQGCQMVYYQTKNSNLGKFWRGSNWKMFGHLVYFLNMFLAIFMVI
jgi:hypothetical protein